jgi:hypothetical protein
MRIGLKMQNFVPANISFVYYRALAFVDPVPLIDLVYITSMVVLVAPTLAECRQFRLLCRSLLQGNKEQAIIVTTLAIYYTVQFVSVACPRPW